MDSCAFDIPVQLVYLQILTLFFCLFSSAFIYCNGKGNKAASSISIFIFILGLWFGLNILRWTTHDFSINLLLERLTILAGIDGLFLLYFAYNFVGKDIGRKKMALFALPFLPVVLSIFSDYNLYAPSAGDCNFVDGPASYYGYGLVMIYTIWSVALLVKKYRDELTPATVRLQIKILISDIVFIVLWLISFLIVESYVVSHGIADEEKVVSFLLLGVMLFISVIVYAIQKGILLTLNPFSKNIFVGVLWATLFLILFVVQPGTIFSIVAFLLYLFLIVIFWII